MTIDMPTVPPPGGLATPGAMPTPQYGRSFFFTPFLTLVLTDSVLRLQDT